ncbi:hypothetical protein O6H91_22G036300 [Diphasiastrum complanatum]|uniref:Uncharacterized protein n=1 Tax=Diphasiastrum complanatum TaxID=34168 RepID=A0ACC2AEM0_DIPCM|nr:hypothetical protein O6H91_22G036300 [Diphasiastrum complanatum]
MFVVALNLNSIEYVRFEEVGNTIVPAARWKPSLLSKALMSAQTLCHLICELSRYSMRPNLHRSENACSVKGDLQNSERMLVNATSAGILRSDPLWKWLCAVHGTVFPRSGLTIAISASEGSRSVIQKGGMRVHATCSTTLSTRPAHVYFWVV